MTFLNILNFQEMIIIYYCHFKNQVVCLFHFSHFSSSSTVTIAATEEARCCNAWQIYFTQNCNSKIF